MVLAGNGDGTFQTAPQYTSGGEPYAQVIDGDFSGSGRLDLVTSDPTGITFYVGNGDGTFGVARSTGLVGAALTAGEFAGNGTYGIAVLGSNSLAVWPQWLLEGTSSGSVTNVLFTSLVDQPHQVQCSYAGDTDYAQSDSSPVSLSYQPAAVPVFAPVPGTYPGKISVTAFPQSTGTTIYYTTDGSTPTTSSTLYTSAITVSSSVTIKAIASGSGYADSNVAVAVYSIQAPSPLVPQPVITPVSGAYFSSQTVAITDSQSGATIHYTTDGSAATANSPVYQGSFTVSTNTTVKAIAVAAGYQNSPPAWSVYTFGPIGSEAQLKITGSNPYQMSCSVSGRVLAGLPGPTGTITFADTTSGQTLGSVSLGTATNATAFPTPASPFTIFNASVVLTKLVIGDFNGDGIPDVIALSNGAPITVFLGNGDGTLQPPVGLQSIFVQSAVSGDFNRDGKLDLAVFSLGTVTVYLGNGDGTFHVGGITSGMDSSAVFLAVGDFLGEGIPSLAVEGADGISIWQGNGDGTFRFGTQLASSAGFRNPIVVGRFNEKGGDDIVAYVETATGSAISIWVSNSDGTFQSPVSYTLPFNVSLNAVPGIFNNAGHLDLAFASQSTIFFLLGNGDGTFQNGYNYKQPAPSGQNFGPIAVGHFNGSASLGLASVGSNPQNLTGVLYILNGNGDATLQSPSMYSLPLLGPGDVYSADLDGDGKTDVLTMNRDSQVRVSDLRVFLNTMEATATGSVANISVDPGTTTTHNFQCSYAGDSHYDSSTSAGVIETYKQLPTPVFSLKVGQYTGPQTVSISGSGAGATYYYTIDGSTPTASSTLYTGPFVITTATTLKAIAVEAGFITSAVSEAVYSVASTPTFSPAPGQYSAPQTVTITDSTAFATIFYTLDGSTPTTLSTKYIAPVLVPANATLKAMATASNFINSAVASGAYAAPAQPTTTVLKASANSVALNQPVTLTATVTGTSPTGNVNFLANGSALGTGNLSSGVATYTATFSTAGTYSITAQYSGDQGNTASISGAVSVMVGTADFTPPPTPPSQSVSPGGTASYQLTFTAVDGYSGTVNLGCSGLPAEATCSFDPVKLGFSGSGNQTTVLNISTTAPTARLAAPGSRGTPSQSSREPLLWAGLTGFLLSIGRLRWRSARLRFIGASVLFAALAIAANGCGGGGSSSGGGGHSNAGTPAGTYVVTVTASDAAANLQHTVTLNLVVK